MRLTQNAEPPFKWVHRGYDAALDRVTRGVTDHRCLAERPRCFTPRIGIMPDQSVVPPRSGEENPGLLRRRLIFGDPERSLLHAGGRIDEAAANLEEALRVARRQQAKAYELRAATSLARLWGEQGRRTEARELLAPVYGWVHRGLRYRRSERRQGAAGRAHGVAEYACNPHSLVGSEGPESARLSRCGVFPRSSPF
jgi:hypothetical protein